jgi:hypothetical protein
LIFEEGTTKPLTKHASKASVLLNDALEGFSSIFERLEMVGLNGTPTNPAARSIKSKVEHLNDRLTTYHTWNMGEVDEFRHLVQEIRKVVDLYKEEGKDILAELEKKFKMGTEVTVVQYGNMAKIMMGQKSGDEGHDKFYGHLVDTTATPNEIIKGCNDLQDACPVGRVFQSANGLSPLYTDAIAVHDDRRWKYGEQKQFEDVKVGTIVKEIKKVVPKLFKTNDVDDGLVGKVTSVNVNERTVTILWPEYEKFGMTKEGKYALIKFPAKTQTKRFRFEKKPFEKFMAKYEDIEGVQVSFGPLKRLYRVIEKMLRAGNDLEVAAIMDVVRGTITCDSNATIRKVLKKLGEDRSITICKVKEGYSKYEFGNWVDVKVIFYLNPLYGADGERIQENWTERQHKCELQIVHRLMSYARTNMGGHKTYSRYRGLGETITALQGDTQRTVQFAQARTCIVNFLSTGDTDEIEELRHLFGMENAIGSVSSTVPRGVAALSLERYLEQYPKISLDEYEDNGDFWFINKDWPGLRIISKDPFIILLPGLLSKDRCKELMRKAGPHMKQSKNYNTVTDEYEVDKDRSSWELRFSSDEVPATQHIFEKALNVPLANMEPLKAIRYAKGERFTPHNDGTAYLNKEHEDGIHECDKDHATCATPYANRVVTLFVYLNTPASGGETIFMRNGLKVQPFAGMGVVHFPAYLSSARYVSSGAVERGTKVKAVYPGTRTACNGTVVDVKDGAVWVYFDFWAPGKHDSVKYNIAKEGDLELAENDYQVLPDLKGELDERAIHAGAPAAEEKFIVSQWCWPGPHDHRGDSSMVVTPLNDGVVL